MNKKRLIKNHAKLNIVKRVANRTSLFSKYCDLNLNDVDDDLNQDQFENVSDNLSNNLDCKLSLNDTKSIRKQIQKKKDIKNNIFAIRESKSIKNATPIKQQTKSTNDSLSVELLNGLKNDLVDALDDVKAKHEKKPKKNKQKRTLETNSDLYAKNISRSLKDADFDLIKFIIDQIGPKEAYKCVTEASRKKCKLLADSINDSNIDISIDMTDLFIKSILDSQQIQKYKKQMILDYKITHKPKTEGGKSKKRIKKKVNLLNFDLDKLCLSTNDTNDTKDKSEVKKEAKKFDFK